MRKYALTVRSGKRGGISLVREDGKEYANSSICLVRLADVPRQVVNFIRDVYKERAYIDCHLHLCIFLMKRESFEFPYKNRMYKVTRMGDALRLAKVREGNLYDNEPITIEMAKEEIKKMQNGWKV